MNDICIQCGEPLVKGAVFCGSCGQKIDQEAKPIVAEPKKSNGDIRLNVVVLKTIGIIAVWSIAIAIIAHTGGRGGVVWLIAAGGVSGWIMRGCK